MGGGPDPRRAAGPLRRPAGRLPVSAAVFALFLLAAIPVTTSDLRDRRIPNAAVAAGLALALWWAWSRGEPALVDALLGGALGVLLFGGLWLLFRGRLGMGDVKYAAVVGAFCGAAGFFLAAFVAAFIGLLAALVLIAKDRRNVRARIPFAPFLSVGGAAALAAQLSHWPAVLFGGVS
jgi:prepilin signal peptidase PulO-like enzyme (type II secretory pathway)